MTSLKHCNVLTETSRTPCKEMPNSLQGHRQLLARTFLFPYYPFQLVRPVLKIIVFLFWPSAYVNAREYPVNLIVNFIFAHGMLNKFTGNWLRPAKGLRAFTL